MLDLIVRGGEVVTPQGVGRWDVGVAGEQIAAVAAPGTLPEAGRVIDVSGKVVVPGGVEPHTHLAHYISMHPDEDLYTLGPEDDTLGMAWGGTTTHVDFCFVRPGQDEVAAAIEQRLARWQDKSYVDYSFHLCLAGPLPLRVFEQVPDAIEQGFASIKVFTANILPPHARRQGNRLDFGRIQLTMEKAARSGGIVAVHAEDEDLVQFNYEKARAEGTLAGWNMANVHNKLSEAVSFRRTIQIAEAAGAAVYFVHTSAREGVAAVAEARARGLPVYAETLHHYASFTAADYRTPRGFCYHTYPSLKFPEDREALWDGLVHGGVSTTATDEFPTSLVLKLKGQTVEDVTGGNLGAEARMGIVYTEGVAKRGMSLERFAAVTSTNAARILGLYPKKGAIAPGSDADLVVIDPSIHKRLTRDDFHVSDYSPWEGWEVRGWPVLTMLRGKVIVADGRFAGDLHDGQFVARKIDPAVLRRPVC